MLTFPIIAVRTFEVKTLVGNVVTNDCSAGVCEAVVGLVVVCKGNMATVSELLEVTVSIIVCEVSEPIRFQVVTICCFRVANDVVLVIVEVAVVVILSVGSRVVLVLGLSIVVSVADVCVGVRPFCIIFDDVGKSGNDTGPMKAISSNKLWQYILHKSNPLELLTYKIINLCLSSGLHFFIWYCRPSLLLFSIRDCKSGSAR